MNHFSVIVPLFNKQNHIARAINSIIKQENSQFEIIVVDDKSTDDSVSIVKNLKDKRIKLIELNKNMGASAARNEGVKAASYDYISFLDADDEWDNNFLANTQTLINKFSEANFFSTAYRSYHSRDSIENSGSYYKFPPNWCGIVDDYFKLAKEIPIAKTSCVTIKKEDFCEAGGFPLNILHGEDLDLWCMLALQSKLAFCNKPCVTYYCDADNQISKEVHDIKYYFANYAKEKYEKFTPKDNKGSYKAYFNLKEMEKTKLLILNNDRKQALKTFLTSFSIMYNLAKWIYIMIIFVFGIKFANKIRRIIYKRNDGV